MRFIKIIIYIAVSLVLLEAGYFLGKYTKVSPLEQKSASVSTDILSITQPVYTFSGIIDNIKDNTITVKQQIIPYSPPIQALSTGKSQPTPVVKIFSFKFTVSENTQISKNSMPVNYLFKSLAATATPKLTIKNLRKGQQVIIQTNADLRINLTSIPLASSINIQGGNNLLTGKITEVNEKSIKLLVYLPFQASTDGSAPPSAPETIEYFINVTSDTEISRYSSILPGSENNLPKPVKLSLSDLKKDHQVNVNIKDDEINASTNLTALRIEPFDMPNVSPNPTLPSISPVTEPDLTIQEATAGSIILPESSQASPSNL
jgi:hypothetical protein